MDFFKKYLRETLETIKKFGNGIITVKRIRLSLKIKASDRSKINFIWRGLKNLVDIHFLDSNGSKNPKKYMRTYPEVEIDVENIISQVLRKRVTSHHYS